MLVALSLEAQSSEKKKKKNMTASLYGRSDKKKFL